MKHYNTHRKKYKKCVEFYENHITSTAFKEYCKKRDDEGRANHAKYIEEEGEHLKGRTDFFEESSIGHIVIADILSNEGVCLLLQKLYSLPKHLYRVKNYYKKPTIFKKYDYIQLQYSHSSTAIFAEIEFLKDKYIDKISICWSQINNYYALLEYDFHFKKFLNEKLLEQFVRDNKYCFTKKDMLLWYRVHDIMDFNYSWMGDFEMELFPLICQHYITTFLYSEQGQNHQLLNLVTLVRKQPLNIDTLYMGMFSSAFYNKKDNYVIVQQNSREDSYLLLSGNNLIPHFGITSFISHYGNEFYYRFFGYRELQLFEEEFSQFSTGRKEITYNKKLKSLLNKMQSITDGRTKALEDFEKNFRENWTFYYANKKEDFNTFGLDYLSEMQSVYKKNFDYLKILTELNYTKSNKWISIIATIISIVATIVSVIGIFC